VFGPGKPYIVRTKMLKVERVVLKGTYYAKSTFTWCLDINVC